MSEIENPCRAFFEQHALKPNKVELLQQTGNAYEWERFTASRYSPGIVQSTEQVLRLVINPIHVDPETGGLKPPAVSDVKDKGCSVERLTHTTTDDSIARGRKVASSKNLTIQGGHFRSICGVINLSVEEIRQIKVGGNTQAFCVFDTALEGNHAHADVCQVAPSGGHEARSARGQLFVLANRGHQSVQ